MPFLKRIRCFGRQKYKYNHFHVYLLSCKPQRLYVYRNIKSAQQKLQSPFSRKVSNDTKGTNTLFFQIFGFVAFIEQKENENNDNLRKIHVGLYNASALMTSTNHDVIA